ncbi:hypothetical protein [Agrococcus sp. TF02-05]|uniref:hypothetical protein n=1 Tax=Agrococcus sp. TF02-05 TaxID=2815211 RepID=UPI001AA17074|nr:hypothetical protein [Agrococcus sp. TF02-05]MBO1769525.1 hypothetical protein [Agrococcus sp. TF02-05]
MTADAPAADGREPEADAGEPAERAESARLVIRKRGRRVTTDPVPGYMGGPEPEPQQPSSENDARLRGDVPPHWG